MYVSEVKERLMCIRKLRQRGGGCMCTASVDNLKEQYHEIFELQPSVGDLKGQYHEIFDFPT